VPLEKAPGAMVQKCALVDWVAQHTMALRLGRDPLRLFGSLAGSTKRQE
jgi:hypothetical protein